VYKPNQVLLDFGAQPLMLGKAACISLGIQRSELESWSFQIQTSFAGTNDRSHFMTREILSMQMKSDHATDSSRLGVIVVVYDALLSPLLDPLEGLSMLNCGKLGLEGRS
jgi:hypothetical protein